MEAAGFSEVRDIYSEENVEIKKECIGHVQKRGGSALRKLKEKKGLGGKRKLTDVLIDRLQNYFCKHDVTASL